MSDLHQILDINDDHPTNSVTDDLVEATEAIDANDSDYEDIEDDHEVSRIKEQLESTSILKESPVKTTGDEEENQHVPSGPPADQVKQTQADENDKRNPTYVPRKGKFFEHDDRTSKEDRSSEQRAARNHNRAHREPNGKWQHDLYFQDQQTRKMKPSFSQPSPRSGANDHGSQSTPRKPTSNHDDRQRTFNNRKNSPRRDNDRFQSDDWRKDSNHAQIVYPKRNLINRQLHQTERRTTQETSTHRNDPRRLATSSINTHYPGNHREERKDLPQSSAVRPRNILAAQSTRTDQQRPMQKREPKSIGASAKASPRCTNIEAPKRYSAMRHGLPSPSFRNDHEQNDWLQAPPSPLSAYFSEQKFPPSPSSRHYPQVSRYFPMNDSQPSLTRDVSENERSFFNR